MKALLVTGNLARAELLVGTAAQLAEPIALDVATVAAEALRHVRGFGLDACIVDLVRPPADADDLLLGRLRLSAPHVSLMAIVRTNAQAVEAVGAGADGFVKPGPLMAESLADGLRAAMARKPTDDSRLRVLYVSRAEPVRDATVMVRVNLDVVTPTPGAATLPSPHGAGPLAYDAILMDMSGGAEELVEVLQDVVTRAADQPVVVLCDAGDRMVGTIALRLGARHIVAKTGAWPLRMLAALEQAATTRKIAADAQSIRASEARLRLIVESLPIGIAVITPAGAVLAMNRSGLAATGLESLGTIDLLDNVAPDDRTPLQTWLQDVSAGASRTIRLRWRHESFGRTLEVSGAPLTRDGAGALILASVVPVAQDDPPPLRRREDRAETQTAGVSLEDHAALKAHFDRAVREASLLRVLLSQLEAERQAYGSRAEQDLATLREGAEQAARRTAALEARLAQAEDLLRVRTEELDAAGQLGDRLRAGHEAALAERSREQLTVCNALDAAEQTRAVVVGQHAAQLDELRAAFIEREAAQTTRMSALESEADALRKALEDTVANAARQPLPPSDAKSQGRDAIDTSAHQHFEAMGRVSGAFVRQIASHLNAVRQFVAAATDEQERRTVSKGTRDALRHVDRAQDLAQQFLAYRSSREEGGPWLPLGETLSSLEPLLQHLTGRGVRLTVEGAPDDLQVMATRETLVRTLSLLVSLAAEALPLGGHVTVSPLSPEPTESDGALITLVVRATGYGQRPMRDPGRLDAELTDTHATLQLLQDPEMQSFELTLRARSGSADSRAEWNVLGSDGG